MRVPINKEIDLGVLTERLKGALGRGVSLSARMAGQVDGKGEPLPGVLIVLDAETGQPLELNQGQLRAVEKAIDAHTPPVPAQSPAKTLSEALATADTVEELKAALVAYADSVVFSEDRGRGRR